MNGASCWTATITLSEVWQTEGCWASVPLYLAPKCLFYAARQHCDAGRNATRASLLLYVLYCVQLLETRRLENLKADVGAPQPVLWLCLKGSLCQFPPSIWSAEKTSGTPEDWLKTRVSHFEIFAFIDPIVFDEILVVNQLIYQNQNLSGWRWRWWCCSRLVVSNLFLRSTENMVSWQFITLSRNIIYRICVHATRIQRPGL